MKILKFISLGILYMIGLVIFATILALGTIISYYPLQTILFGRGDYLLFISGDANMIPVYMIIGLIIYFVMKLKDKLLKRKVEQIEPLEDEEPIDVERLSKKEKTLLRLLNKLMAFDDIAARIFKLIKVCYIPALIIAMYCGLTSYAIVYTDSVKLGSPLNPSGTTYKYTDVAAVNVYINKYKRNSYEPLYIITFNDGKSVNLFGSSMHEKSDKSFEYIILDIDKKLRSQEVIKTVNKTYFDNYSKNLDKNFTSRVEKLFDNR
jgi:hypothetical protein